MTHFSNPAVDGCSDCNMSARDMTPEQLRLHQDICLTCKEPVPIGGWPFCASPRNPEGHARGTYRWGMRHPMATKGWERNNR